MTYFESFQVSAKSHYRVNGRASALALTLFDKRLSFQQIDRKVDNLLGDRVGAVFLGTALT